MALQPSAVTANANDKLCLIEMVWGDTTRSAPDRMAEITALCDEFRAAVSGSTTDPFSPKARNRFRFR